MGGGGLIFDDADETSILVGAFGLIFGDADQTSILVGAFCGTKMSDSYNDSFFVQVIDLTLKASFLQKVFFSLLRFFPDTF